MIPSIKPIDGKLIVEVIKRKEETSAGGIILTNETTDPDQEHPHDTLRALVISAGKNKEGIEKGNVVFFEQRHSSPIFNNEYKTIKCSDILGQEMVTTEVTNE